MRTWIGVAVAGPVGALLRYGIEGLVTRRTSGAFPWGTLLVNVTGSFVLGLLFWLLTERFVVATWLRTAVTIGFVGAYTTFSTLSYETFRLIEDRAYALAVTNGLGSLVLGLVAVYLRVVVGRGI